MSVALDPASTASPRLYARHVRHAIIDRLRHRQQELSFLDSQATRLSTTAANVYTKLSAYTADQITNAASLSDIP